MAVWLDQCPPGSLQRQQLNLLKSDKYSDLSVYCGSQIFNTHKSVVCCGSTQFAKVCESMFKVLTPLPLPIMAHTHRGTLGVSRESNSPPRRRTHFDSLHA